MKLSLILSILLCASSHPIAMIILLILLTLILAMALLWSMKTSWFSMIFVLIMLGGMLVLFIYMASLASNESFLYSNIIYFCIPLLFLPMNKSFIFKAPLYNQELLILFSSFSAFNNFVSIFYLLFTLLVVIEIISNFKSPLRSNN